MMPEALNDTFDLAALEAAFAAGASGMSRDEVKAAAHALDNALPSWRALAPPRQRALLGLVYHVGIVRIMAMPFMLAALAVGDGIAAATELWCAPWPPDKAWVVHRAAALIRTGETFGA